MKKNSLSAIANFLRDYPEMNEYVQEIDTELAKSEAKAQANRDLYAVAHDVVIAHLTSEPQTTADLFAKCQDVLPDGFSKSKLQYALSNYWNTEVKKDTTGKVNTYFI